MQALNGLVRPADFSQGGRNLGVRRESVKPGSAGHGSACDLGHFEMREVEPRPRLRLDQLLISAS